MVTLAKVQLTQRKNKQSLSKVPAMYLSYCEGNYACEKGHMKVPGQMAGPSDNGGVRVSVDAISMVLKWRVQEKVQEWVQ